MRNAANFVIVATAILLALIYGQNLIIPFVFAFLFWFLTSEIRKLMDRIPFIKKYFPVWLKNVFVFILMVMGLGTVADILSHSINSLSASYEQYEPNIASMMQEIGVIFQIDVGKSIEAAMGDFDFGNALKNILNGLSGLLGNTFMIIIYAIFIFLEESSFKEKVKKLFLTEEHHQNFNNVLGKIETSVFDYLRLKTIVSLLTGTLSYIVLALVGIDSPIFWAFLIFLLNYIPTIGSLIATLFPAAFSLIQFGEFSTFAIVLVAVGGVQVVVGNIIEPKIMGKSLNLSPLVTIIALAVWGQIWGVTGMILSVPITVSMVIVFSQFEKTKRIAIMLSENGEIE